MFAGLLGRLGRDETVGAGADEVGAAGLVQRLADFLIVFGQEELEESLLNRMVIKQTDQINDTHWDYSPFFDATKQYCR